MKKNCIGYHGFEIVGFGIEITEFVVEGVGFGIIRFGIRIIGFGIEDIAFGSQTRRWSRKTALIPPGHHGSFRFLVRSISGGHRKFRVYGTKAIKMDFKQVGKHIGPHLCFLGSLCRRGVILNIHSGLLGLPDSPK